MKSLIILGVMFFGCFAMAEGGISGRFCGDVTCPCGSEMCTCGQLCLNDTCRPAQAGYCFADGQCAATCGTFRCRGNFCQVDDGGFAGAGGGGGGGAAGRGGCGCTSAGVLPMLGLFAGAALFRRRRVG